MEKLIESSTSLVCKAKLLWKWLLENFRVWSRKLESKCSYMLINDNCIMKFLVGFLGVFLLTPNANVH